MGGLADAVTRAFGGQPGPKVNTEKKEANVTTETSQEKKKD
jgi:hypothetical protein